VTPGSRCERGGDPSLVEVDLLRAGDSMPLLGAAPTKDYRILVSRGNRRPRADRAWAASVLRAAARKKKD
jgi:hypothetical protein